MDLSISSISLALSFCQQYTHTGGWHQSRTWPDYTIYCIRSGELAIRVEGREYAVHSGDTVFLFPGDHGTMRALCECEFLLVCFRMDFGNYRHLFYQFNSAGVCGSLTSAVEALARAFPREGLDPLRFTPRQYAAFMGLLAELLDPNLSHAPFHKPSPQYNDWKLNRLLAMMEESTPETVPIRVLAARMEMSEKYFIQYFRSQVGCTPGEYMNRQKMQLAVELLSDPKLTLEEVAHSLHYADPYSFSKAFRRFYGEPPGSFRGHLK